MKGIEPEGTREPGRLGGRLLRHALWGASVLGLAAVAAAAVVSWRGTGAWQAGSKERPLEGLQVFWAVPEFSLVERSGRPVTLADLRGKVWIASFVYTECKETCPLQTAHMAQLQRDLAGERDLRFVSITVDPKHDTPAVLSEYAKRYGADPDRWLFLTGDKRAIYRLAKEGFRLSVADPDDQAQGVIPWPFGARPAYGTHGSKGIVIHSSRLVLVDREARTRGYYDGTDPEAMKRLGRDVRTLLGKR